MTIREKMEQMLFEHGMFESQAKEVMDKVEKEEVEMKGRWDDEETDYPTPMINVAWIAVKHHALEWIDANLPKAWYRPMFL